jgi:hypothetical protein
MNSSIQFAISRTAPGEQCTGIPTYATVHVRVPRLEAADKQRVDMLHRTSYLREQFRLQQLHLGGQGDNPHRGPKNIVQPMAGKSWADHRKHYFQHEGYRDYLHHCRAVANGQVHRASTAVASPPLTPPFYLLKHVRAEE